MDIIKTEGRIAATLSIKTEFHRTHILLEGERGGDIHWPTKSNLYCVGASYRVEKLRLKGCRENGKRE